MVAGRTQPAGTARQTSAQLATQTPARQPGLFKDAVVAILATIAKQERIRRSERAKAAIEVCSARGQ